VEQPRIVEPNREKSKRADERVLLAFHLFHRLFAAHELARRFASTWLINEDNQTTFLALVLLTLSFLRHSNSPPAPLLLMNPYIFRGVKLFSKRAPLSCKTRTTSASNPSLCQPFLCAWFSCFGWPARVSACGSVV
jgi:hypothetical protein